ncbi:Uncharacterized protein APZ42_029361 [Daphnia magna]|uniref:Uncharacterized protein n=1 Tax=Daphnia magna TaxID=35525 RepID=A0A164PHN8_9CRUS|nr:Uncharacterized protein APZ42_029361 [Daphnia magna]
MASPFSFTWYGEAITGCALESIVLVWLRHTLAKPSQAARSALESSAQQSSWLRPTWRHSPSSFIVILTLERELHSADDA